MHKSDRCTKEVDIILGKAHCLYNGEACEMQDLHKKCFKEKEQSEIGSFPGSDREYFIEGSAGW